MSFRLGRFDKLTMKRFFIIFGLIFTLFFSFASPIITSMHPAYATDPTYAAVDPAYAWWGEGLWNKIKTGIGGVFTTINEFAETHVSTWIRNAGASILNLAIYSELGTDSEEIAKAETLEDAFAHGYGLVGGMAMAIGEVYNNPPDIHLASFFKSELSDNLLAPPAYATFGTDILFPIKGIWERVRNIAYAAFIVVVGAIALMIILQKQLPPREVVTVTHAIPKIFFSLILITLSYPLAALFVDLFIVWLPAVLTEVLAVEPLIDTLRNLLSGELGAPKEAIASTWGEVGHLFALSIVLSAGSVFSSLTALVVIAIMGILSIFVFGCVLLQLLYRYARIIILTVLAPLYLLLGALPGQEEAISGWFKDLAVQTLVFPGILFTLYLSIHILVSGPLAGFARFQEVPGIGAAFFTASSQILLPFVALIIFLMSFKIPGIIENAIKGKGRK